MAFLALSTKSVNINSESEEKACHGSKLISFMKSFVVSGHLTGLLPLSFSILYYYSSSLARSNFFSFWGLSLDMYLIAML